MLAQKAWFVLSSYTASPAPFLYIPAAHLLWTLHSNSINIEPLLLCEAVFGEASFHTSSIGSKKQSKYLLHFSQEVNAKGTDFLFVASIYNVQVWQD